MTTAPMLKDQLRQMLAVLEDERQALAGLDIDALTLMGKGKHTLCAALEAQDAQSIDEECRALLLSARHANEVNRRIRNLVSANVAARLDALTQRAGTYNARPRPVLMQG
ncbi:hypothetical protein [Aurantiacibacter luteus]|uniref:Flagellar protein FlgN n=1 Tax=Aurantiacibacter luteus TaxID=1581420 RepID=A0A0G9MKN1_9SPHN|nr:hypothetical protein [Aurantiacibacter luteus]KLE31245.1 hypothetical protein AAW00_13850 [Aurantiacibacter luteus]